MSVRSAQWMALAMVLLSAYTASRDFGLAQTFLLCGFILFAAAVIAGAIERRP